MASVRRQAHVLGGAPDHGRQRRPQQEEDGARQHHPPAPAVGVHHVGEERREQGAADADGTAHQRHGPGAPTVEPAIGEGHGAVHEAGAEGQRDDPQVDEQQGQVGLDPVEQQVARTGQQDRGHHDGARSQAVDQIPRQRSFEGSLGPGQAEHQGGGRAADAKVLAQRQDEDGEAVEVEAAAEEPEEAAHQHHPPTEEGEVVPAVPDELAQAHGTPVPPLPRRRRSRRGRRTRAVCDGRTVGVAAAARPRVRARLPSRCRRSSCR